MKAITLKYWRSLQFYRHFRKNRLALALSQKPRLKGTKARELWAMYRLGMYASVASSTQPYSSWQVCFAKAVSHAACGDLEAARAAKAAFLKCRKTDGQREHFSDALAPFLPTDALDLIDEYEGVSPALMGALLMRNGLTDRARELLGTLPPQAVHDYPELQLLRTNVSGGSPAEQLQRLNAFLGAHGVASLRLRDGARPPAPCNVATADSPATVGGPLVSVLMTTFRTGARAASAIESVLAQSYQNLELIVVDDASGDDTVAQIRALTQDPRVRFVSLPRNVGTYVAKMIGLALAKGEFVTCHDSDDWSHPEKIARQVAPLLADQKLIGTVSSWVRMQDDGVFYARPVHPLMRMNPSSLLFRRERVLREAGAWDCVRTGADSEFMARLRIVFGPKAIKKIGQPLSLGSHRPDSLMTAASTGYSETGMSPQRLAYWEAWSHWHIDTLARGAQPFLPSDVRAAVASRPFSVLPAQTVPPEDVEACWQAVFGQAT